MTDTPVRNGSLEIMPATDGGYCVAEAWGPITSHRVILFAGSLKDCLSYIARTYGEEPRYLDGLMASFQATEEPRGFIEAMEEFHRKVLQGDARYSPEVQARMLKKWRARMGEQINMGPAPADAAP